MFSALIATVWGKVQYVAGGLIVLLAGILSALFWGYERGKDSERTKSLEAERKAKEIHDAKIADAADARNQSLAKDARNSSVAADDSAGVNGGVRNDPYANDPYRRD